MKIKVETEKKYYCIEPEKLIEQALSLNFKEIQRVIETDEYFTDIESEFIKNRTCLRIRKKDNNMEITYKGKSNSLLGQYCKLENNISCNIEEYNNFVNLFSSLGYYSYVEVYKERIIYELKSDKYKYSIMIDKLPELGGFVEFEIISEKENSKKNELKEELNKFVMKFDNLSLKEAIKPYRDIVAENIYDKLNIYNSKQIFINLDSEIMKYEKDFFRKYKEKISEVCNVNIKWGIYKKNNEISNKIVDLIDDYLENLIFDNKEILILIDLINKLKFDVSYLTKSNELFFTHFFGKLNIIINNVLYIKDETLLKILKNNNINLNENIIINDKNIKEIISICLILINN